MYIRSGYSFHEYAKIYTYYVYTFCYLKKLSYIRTYIYIRNSPKNIICDLSIKYNTVYLSTFHIFYLILYPNNI